MSRRTRLGLMILGGSLIAVVIAGLVVLFAFRDVATTLGEEDIGVTVVTGGGEPGDFGLYKYATIGYETTDALGDARHDYPAETYLTVQPGGCGTLVRWQPLEQRYEEWDYCGDGRMAGWYSYFEWFQFGNTDHWECPEPAAVQGEPGSSWTVECYRAETPNAAAGVDTITYQVLGYEPLTVGSQEVQTLHVQAVVVGTAGSVTEGVVDTWYLPDTHLPVRRTVVHDSITDSRIGSVRYHEEAEIQLLSLLPSG